MAEPLSIAVPPGIGDSLWSLTKIPGLLKQEGRDKCDITVCSGAANEVSTRAVEFLKRFKFVRNVNFDQDHLIPCEPFLDGSGRYNYTPSGRGFHHIYDWMIQCNHDLERGVRLENILPEFGTDWDIAKQFTMDDDDWRASNLLAEEVGRDYVMFYAGPETGNTTSGHNRGGLWSPSDWVRLEQGFYDRGLAVVITGAMYDRSYVESFLRPAGFRGVERVGVWPIHSTFACVKRAKACISYQSGIGIFSVFLNVPTVLWWGPKGYSQSREHFISFEESMASAWAPPAMLESGKYLPQIYTRSTPEAILKHADEVWKL